MRHSLPVALFCLALAACSPPPQPPVPAATPASVPDPGPVPPAEPQPEPEPPAAPPEPVSWELPGGLTPMTTQAELEARFGKDNLREDTIPGPEGEGRLPVLVVFPDDPRRRLELLLDAENRDAPIVELRVFSAESQWRDTRGVHPGMSLAELVELNGAPVSFYGLGWDYGGVVQDWHGGRLANGFDGALFHRIVLAVRDGADEARLPAGDGSFRSDDPNWASAGRDLVVGQLGISWPHEGED